MKSSFDLDVYRYSEAINHVNAPYLNHLYKFGAILWNFTQRQAFAFSMFPFLHRLSNIRVQPVQQISVFIS